MFAVHGGGGAEDQLPHAVGLHGCQQGQRAVQIVAVVVQRQAHRFAHGLQPGKMDDAVDGVFLKDLFQRGLIGGVRLIASDGLSGDLRDALGHDGAAVGVVVHDDHVVARVQQLHRRMGADVTGAAGEKNSHSKISF